MKNEYKIQGLTQKVEVQVEKEVVQVLEQMSGHMKIDVSELTNTALKRFIASHKDFLPPSAKKSR